MSDIPIAIPDSVLEDPEVRAASKKLLLDAIAEAQELIDTGAPNVRVTVLKSLLPTAMRTMQSRAESEEMVNMRKELEDMKALILDSVPKVPEPDTNVVHLNRIGVDSPR